MPPVPTASSIEVAIRVRPLRGELRESKTAWRIDATSLTEVAQPDNVFTFDQVYDTASTTAEIYRHNVRDAIVGRVAQGYNGTVFAYGQTGSGKSYTMFGDATAAAAAAAVSTSSSGGSTSSSSASRSPGLIRLAVHDLFKALAAEQQKKPYIHTDVFVSVLEIYNEQLRDLLQTEGSSTSGGGVPAAAAAAGGANRAASSPLAAPTAAPPPPLSIRENEYGVYVHNAVRRQVRSEQECAQVIYSHAASRVSAATMMNEHSSRSHCVIRILVERSHYLEDAAAGADEAEASDEEGEEESEGGAYESTTQPDDDDDADEDDDEDGRASSTVTRQSSSSKGYGSAGGGRRSSRPEGSSTGKLKAAGKHKKKVISTLNLVDLAGSERVAKTGATGLRMVEGGHINKSLTTLTTVINRLASDAANAGAASSVLPSRSGGRGGGAAFVPYRDSRLTHLLKTAIGGNSFTAVLCCITPAIESANESRSTLQFASRAKKIKNKVRVNEVADTQTRLRELEAALRHTKKLLVAQTLYLWSKQLKIRKYEEQLAAGSSGGGVSNGRAPEKGGAGVGAAAVASFASPEQADGDSFAYGTPGARLNQQQQLQMIIAQLTAQNNALREEVDTVKAQLEAAHAEREKAGGSGTTGAAAAEAVAALRRTLHATELTLKEREDALAAAQAGMDELDGLCRELETENKKQADTIRTLTARTNEADELMHAVEEEHGAVQQEVALLRTQLQQSQAKLLAKHRGDDYLAELTRLHVEHQNLQYSYAQMKEKADKDKAELMQRLHRLTEANNTLEDDLDEAKDELQLRNSFLWRLLGTAAQVTQGKPLSIKDTTAAVREAQVAEAVRALTSFAVLAASGRDDGGGSNSISSGAGADVRQLHSRIRALEEQLIAKDAQRDVIIDTKLKRIQGLVLRLHTVNVALVDEMRRCFAENEQLIDIAMKTSKTQKKVEKAGLGQRSLEAALNRARFTQPPHKPLYHN